MGSFLTPFLESISEVTTSSYPRGGLRAASCGQSWLAGVMSFRPETIPREVGTLRQQHDSAGLRGYGQSWLA